MHIEYKGTRDVKKFINLSVDKDYYKPIRTSNVFSSNYIEHEK